MHSTRRPDLSRALRILAILAVLVLAGWLLRRACQEPVTEEDRVRAAIQAVADGAGEADLGAALAPISRAYDDGEFTYDSLRGYLFGWFQRQGPITSLIGEIQVTLDPDGTAAEASFNALLASGFASGALIPRPDDADAFHFQVDLRKEEGDWRIIGHDRRSVEPTDFMR